MTLDAFTASHLDAWLADHVHPADRDDVLDGILSILDEHADLIERGRSWPEIRALAERARDRS